MSRLARGTTGSSYGIFAGLPLQMLFAIGFLVVYVVWAPGRYGFPLGAMIVYFPFYAAYNIASGLLGGFAIGLLAPRLGNWPLAAVAGALVGGLSVSPLLAWLRWDNSVPLIVHVNLLVAAVLGMGFTALLIRRSLRRRQAEAPPSPAS